METNESYTIQEGKSLSYCPWALRLGNLHCSTPFISFSSPYSMMHNCYSTENLQINIPIPWTAIYIDMLFGTPLPFDPELVVLVYKRLYVIFAGPRLFLSLGSLSLLMILV